ncbi:putative endo-1,4-beta-xylanase [Rosa chinensis]|uniref:Putative endo-1,4-beta-xylanase n=1 Tax=Rosa chinensis TaxID=74649 RepID=A0A2P6QKK9_ROSCH|nr:putative endo-1,4-beta-xylanase [Rosa chinensis]
MLKGGLTANASSAAELYFESKNTSVEIWVDSVSLQPFNKKEWKSHYDQSIDKNRKSNVRIQAVDAKGNPLRNATISIQQKAPSFPFGCAMNKNILTNTAYQNWFTSRFGVTTFEDEMKWYSTEPSQGQEDYSVADALLQFAKQQDIAVRGHNVFWDDPQYHLGWVKSLDKQQLALAASKRLNSLGENASAILYNWATKADGATTLFMNDYNTIEESKDGASTPAKYLQKLRDIQGFPGNNNLRMAIGLESHFKTPNIPYIRSPIDTLAALQTYQSGLQSWMWKAVPIKHGTWSRF